MLQFEEDVGEQSLDGKLPILDLKVWIDKTDGVTVLHEFYKKPMATQEATMIQSSTPIRPLSSPTTTASMVVWTNRI